MEPLLPAALAEVQASEFAGELAKAALLYDPKKRLENPLPPEGKYLCATHKLGGQFLAFIAYPDFVCAVYGEGDKRQFVKLTGSQRPVGLIFPDHLKRQIFLGTLELGDEKMAVNYGSDRMRDMAGLVERIGDNRWRLVLPAPAYESLVDVIELVPGG